MSTLLGEYLNTLGVVKERVRTLADIKRPRMNDLNNKVTAKPSPEEFYRIIYIAIKLAGLEENIFKEAIEAIFPHRPKSNLLEEFKHLPVEIRFLKKHTLKQSEVEEKVGMAPNKISRLASEKTKDLLAIELICFIEALGLDVLETLKNIYGIIDEVDNVPLPDPAVLNERVNKVYQYVQAYNQFDVPNMALNLSDTIVFVNIENNRPTTRLEGIDQVKKQANEAISYFSQRQQTIVAMTHKHTSTEIVIDYQATAAKDFSNGIKKGDEIRLKGKSIFEFSPDGSIIKLTDIS